MSLSILSPLGHHHHAQPSVKGGAFHSPPWAYLHKLFRIFLHGRVLSSSPFTYLWISINSWVDEISALLCEAANSGTRCLVGAQWGWSAFEGAKYTGGRGLLPQQHRWVTWNRKEKAVLDFTLLTPKGHKQMSWWLKKLACGFCLKLSSKQRHRVVRAEDQRF